MPFLCCGVEEERPLEDRVPKVKLPPSALAKVIKTITTSGVELAKLTSGGQPRQKVVVLDRRLEKYTFLPSNKAFELRQYEVADIKEIRVGNECTKALRKQNFDDSTHCFAFVVKDDKEFNFACSDEVQRDQLVDLFAFLLRRARPVHDESPHRVRLMSTWLSADADGNGRLTFDELSGTLQELNVAMDRNALRKQFVAVDKDGSGTLDFEEFCEFFDELTLRPELRALFDKYAAGGAEAFDMEPSELKDFLHSCQRENISAYMATELCAKLGGGHPVMSFNDFCRYLTSPTENNVLNPVHRLISDDMTRPFNEFALVASSSSDVSSLVALKAMMRAGVRYLHFEVVEHEKRPVLRANLELSLDAIYRQISEVAFDTSEYPVIIGLSGAYADVKAAAGVAKRHIFKSQQITTQGMKDLLADGLGVCPSDLRKRIILVGFVEPEQQEAMWESEHLGVIRGISLQGAGAALDSIHKDMSESHLASSQRPYMLVADDKLVHERAEDLRHFIDSRGMVVVDAAFRGLQDLLRCGANVCPAKYTAYDQHVAAVSDFFSLNGQCGYRHLPRGVVETVSDDAFEQLAPTRLTIRVLLGTQIPQTKDQLHLRDIIDPFIEVSIVGDRRDEAANAPACTQYVADNGFNPSWTDVFNFNVRRPGMAFVRFRIFDYDATQKHTEIANATLPLASVRLGYRALRFRAVNGDALPYTSLLCHFAATRARPTTSVEGPISPLIDKIVDGTALVARSVADAVAVTPADDGVQTPAAQAEPSAAPAARRESPQPETSPPPEAVGQTAPSESPARTSPQPAEPVEAPRADSPVEAPAEEPVPAEPAEDASVTEQEPVAQHDEAEPAKDTAENGRAGDSNGNEEHGGNGSAAHGVSDAATLDNGDDGVQKETATEETHESAPANGDAPLMPQASLGEEASVNIEDDGTSKKKKKKNKKKKGQQQQQEQPDDA